MFKAIVINKDEQGYRAQLQQLEEAALPAGEVKVVYTVLPLPTAVTLNI